MCGQRLPTQHCKLLRCPFFFIPQFGVETLEACLLFFAAEDLVLDIDKVRTVPYESKKES
jgi:hypothetical protein